jgi:hypothetical protein
MQHHLLPRHDNQPTGIPPLCDRWACSSIPEPHIHAL